MKKTITLSLIIALIILPGALSQQLNQKGSFLVSVNPLKLVYGIINVELEYHVAPAASIQLSTEYVVFHYIVKEERHPDYVIRVGPRYHAFHRKDFGHRNDLCLGAFAGYTWSKKLDQFRSFNLGAETGYKYQFEKPVLLNSKILITCPIRESIFFPGFEFLVGYGVGL